MTAEQKVAIEDAVRTLWYGNPAGSLEGKDKANYDALSSFLEQQKAVETALASLSSLQPGDKLLLDGHEFRFDSFKDLEYVVSDDPDNGEDVAQVLWASDPYYLAVLKTLVQGGAQVIKAAKAVEWLEVFTSEKVDRYNAEQTKGSMHPLTCPNRGDGRHAKEDWRGQRGVLTATVNGWICPECDYKQGWVKAAKEGS